MQNLLDRLDSLAPSERRVAEFLFSSGPAGLVLSAAAIAARVGTSDATVVRTARSLGYDGLGELRSALAAQAAEPLIADRMQRTLADTPANQLLSRSIANQRTGLQTLSERVDSELFERAVTVLASRPRIMWRGVGPSAFLADYGRLLCQRIGRNSGAMIHTGTSFADELLTLSATDAIVLLAYGRPQNHVSVLIDHATAIGAPIVLITDSTDRRLRERVDLTLHSVRGAPGYFASHATTLVLLEALVLGLAATDRSKADATLTTLNDLRAAIAGRRLDVDAI
ncbi:MAG: transcriptional regulator [Acidimicrobiales bacterium]|nr:transcriptional regulator [Acidimicrobiales bacterium]